MSPVQQIWYFVSVFIVLGVSLHFCLTQLGNQPGNFWLCITCLWLGGVGISARILYLGNPPDRRRYLPLRSPTTTG